VDAQTGLKSGVTALDGALVGINIVSGEGCQNFLACHGQKKLVVDAERITIAQRLIY